MSTTSPLPIHSSGIFHGLPTYPSTSSPQSIIVTGANGISGSAMLSLLAASPERWPTVYALSRRAVTVPKGSTNIIAIALDFLSSSPSAIASVLKSHKIQADYIYFASYVQPPPPAGAALWSNVDELSSQNLALLKNFLEALPLASIKPKKFLLQTGGKYYGLHLGPTSIPMHESDPRHGIEPNFYFPQLDLLHTTSKSQSFTWLETRPCFILGAASTSAAMSILLPLALYASVCARLNAPLAFPGDVAAWDALKDQSSADLMVAQAEWALLAPGVANTALNHSDGSPFAWGKFWPVLASWYGLAPGVPDPDQTKYATITMPYAGAPRGFGGPGVIRATFSFAEWSQREDVKKAWTGLKEEFGLEDVVDAFGDGARDVFGLLDAEVLGGWGRVVSMDRSRELGWFGTVDTVSSIKKVIEEMGERGLVPKFM